MSHWAVNFKIQQDSHTDRLKARVSRAVSADHAISADFSAEDQAVQVSVIYLLSLSGLNNFQQRLSPASWSASGLGSFNNKKGVTIN